MKMRRIMSIALAGAMTIGMLAGCGGSSASSTASTSGGEASSELTWKIGMIGPLTGAAALYGTDVANAGQIAVDEINAAGGINGYKIEYNTQDDEHDAEKSMNAYNTLKDWGMQILTGPVTSTPCAAVAALAADDNMFLLTPSGSSLDCIANDNAFAVCFNDPQQGTKSAEYFAEHFPDAVIGTLYDSSTPYSAGIEQNFEAKGKELGINIADIESFTVDTATDFTAQLQKLKEAGCTYVFLPIYYQEASVILQQASNMGFDPEFFGCDGMDGILSMEGFDTSLAEGLMLLTPFSADATDDLTVNFVKSFQEKYSRIPNQFGADQYDGIYALKMAIEKADLTPEASISDICEALKKSITEIKVEGLTGTITWAATGEPDKEPKAVKIENGAYVSIEG
ncbi:MAG: ABC transporter substrate-binding protein [Lachnospiraceae bacterium]|nr:ABC transporter substrate-binding protein [Lachnospiraceae bacterium]